MSGAYQYLALSDVKPGMILSDELLDQQGQVLLPKGAVLSTRTIALLPSHGVERLPVLRPDAQALPAPDPAAIERRLAHLFRKHDLGDDSDWATAELRRCLQEFRLGREGTA